MKTNYINYKRLHEGGTMITNFSMCHYHKYKKAVEIYNSENLPCHHLYVENKAYYGDILLFDWGSLHAVNRVSYSKNLSPFWRIFESL